MAAFSHQDPPFIIDSVNYLPIKSPALLDDVVEFYPSMSPAEFGSSVDASTAHESSYIEQQSINNQFYNNSNNEPSVTTQKQRKTESFVSMADKADSGEQVSQNLVRVHHKKRKSRNGSSPNSANSKDAKQGKSKKQKGEKEATKDEKKDQNQGTEEPSKGYIHVRARRGQATDSHSLAERVRREKIRERMKMLQALVPGCDKVTGKALMLDEIINYVQSLQTQVEFLSMKLASLDPMVYTFGLMDLDLMALGTEGMNNSMALQMPPIQSTTSSSSSGGGGTSQPITFANTNTITSPITTATTTTTTVKTFPSPLLNSSSCNLLLQDQKPTVFPLQDGRSLYWGLDEQQQQQRQSIINPFGFGPNNNLYSLQ